MGVLGHVMPLLFGFDATFEDGETQLPLISARTGPSLTELAAERPTMQARALTTMRSGSTTKVLAKQAPTYCRIS